jgi:hypothetical protein
MKGTSFGRVILTSVATLTSVGSFLADWNRTHLFNPNWPPHAKYHDAQTILLGSLLGASGLLLPTQKGQAPGEGPRARGSAALVLLGGSGRELRLPWS